METKICSKCGKELPVSEFSKNSKTKDGLQCQCKSCQKAAHKEKQERVKKLFNKAFRYPDGTKLVIVAENS